METGEKIREIRKKKGWSQTHLAKILNVSQQTIARYELGRRSLSLKRAVQIATVFSVKVDDLI